jgi:hypothetical protein
VTGPAPIRAAGALRLAADALARAARWRVLLLSAVATALPALLGVAPLALFLDASLAHVPGGGSLASRFETSLLPDLSRRAGEQGTMGAIAFALLGAVAVALVLSPWLAGAALAEVSSPERLRGRALLTGAGAFWGRLVRLGLVALLPLGVATGLAAWFRHLAERSAEHATSQTAALATGRASLLAALAAFALALATLDAARAVLAARPARRSALLAWTSGTWLVLRRPAATLSAWLLGTGLGLALALLMTALRTRLPAGPVPSMVASLAVASLAAASLAFGRSVRLGLLTRIAGADAAAREARAEAHRGTGLALEGAQRAAAAETAARRAAEASLGAAQAEQAAKAETPP